MYLSKYSKNLTFSGVGFGETAASEAKMMLEEHATGWGLKRDVDDDDVESLVLTWKGHSVVFASSCCAKSSNMIGQLAISSCLKFASLFFFFFFSSTSNGISSDELEKLTF
ncbi:BnaA09g07360D [Brassica napus]|uniref:BnaA09g07360D protein n=1 Tax=Brassica napus TaxID=3708 RepID=A0A078FZP8_BRANA|nr:BnaA09g07360D [Brassica napus]